MRLLQHCLLSLWPTMTVGSFVPKIVSVGHFSLRWRHTQPMLSKPIVQRPRKKKRNRRENFISTVRDWFVNT